MQEWHSKNKEKSNLRTKEYRKNNKEKIKLQNKEYQKTLKGRYIIIKNGAKQRKLNFEITFEDYENNFYLKPCQYCSEISTGIDRIDSNFHYVINNVVPCCSICNEMKMERSVSDFKKQIIKIYFNMI